MKTFLLLILLCLGLAGCGDDNRLEDAESRLEELQSENDDLKAKLESVSEEVSEVVDAAEEVKIAVDDVASAVDGFSYSNWRDVADEVSGASGDLESAYFSLDLKLDSLEREVNY